VGLDLSILPFEADTPNICYSHSILRCSREGPLFDEIMAIEKQHGKVVPEGFTSYLCRDKTPEGFEEPHYGRTRKTPYGDELKYITVAQFLTLEELDDLQPPTSGVVAYLRELPLETKIALYWS